MQKTAIALASMLLMFAVPANAHNLSSRVTGTVGGVGSTANGATAGVTGIGGSQSSGSAAISSGTMSGGDLPGGFGVKAGDKVIQFRGAVGVGDDRSNFRAGVGIPFRIQSAAKG